MAQMDLVHVADDTTYMDAIDVPRGVPEQYKLVDQVATGFENLPIISAIFPITPNKNVDRINFLHFQLMRANNYTHNMGRGLAQELHANTLALLLTTGTL